MATTALEYTKEAQDKTLEAIKQGQAVVVEAVAAWAKAAEKTNPAGVPAIPGTEQLPTPTELVKTTFDFYAEVLEAQRAFATDIIAAAAPVAKAVPAKKA